MVLCNIILKTNLIKSSNYIINAYFHKTPFFLHRFRSRLVNDYATTHAPDEFGEENLDLIGHKIQNPLIRQIIRPRSHPEEPLFPNEYSLDGPPYGRIYSDQPFKYTVQKGAGYLWCSCGNSANNPFCDFSHKLLWTRSASKRVPKHRPIKYVANETKEVWFCNCKQSASRPICDGTCKTDAVKLKFNKKPQLTT